MSEQQTQLSADPSLEVATEDTRQAIEDALFTMVMTESLAWRTGLGRPDQDYHRGILRADEYPGAGVIMPVAGASVALGKNGQDWQYGRRTKTSHSGTGHQSSESITCLGGIVTASSRTEGRAERSARIDLSTENPEEVGRVIQAMQRLTLSLALYRDDAKAFSSLHVRDFGQNYRAYDAARARSWPPRHFGYNILDLRPTD